MGLSMRRVSMPVLVAMAAVLVPLAVVAAGPAPAGASMPQLVATGSSFAGVAISQWEGQFNEGGGNINFTVSSSIIGLNDFCNRTVDFGASDLSFAASQSDCTATQVPYPYQYVPDVAGALGFEYNLEGSNGKPITNLTLNAAAIAGIFTGAINSWDDPSIQSLNPTIKLPDEPITAYYRSDPSGENYLLSSYLLATEPTEITAFQQTADVPSPGQPSATWAAFANVVPQNLRSLDGVSGSDAASQGPAQVQGGISYVETAYSKNVNLPVAEVVNAAGNAVLPTAYDAEQALQSATLNADSTENLSGVFDSTATLAYPLSSYSYLVTQCDPTQAAAQGVSCDGDGTGTDTMDAAQGAELSQFISFVACLGQAKMDALGYVPLPPNLVEDDFQAAGRLPGGTEPPPPTAQNCANPTLGSSGDGSIGVAGSLISEVAVGSATLTLPAPAVGDAWVLVVRASNPANSVESISGGGVGKGWTRLSRVSDAVQHKDIEEWLGPISRAGGASSAVSVTFTGPLTGTTVELVAQQFGSGAGASTVWSGDVGNAIANDTPSSTVSFPSLTPTASNELYVGFSRSGQASAAGTTPGFTYDTPSVNNLYIYDPDVSSAVSPTASQQSGRSITIGALIEAN